MLKLVNNSIYFKIVINALHESLDELNIYHDVVENYSLDDDHVYLICTTHENRSLPKRYISYNFEQLTTNKVWNPSFFEQLKKAELVFDYSLENIKELEKYNIKAHFLPLGYSKTMENNICNKKIDKTVDFSFVGWVNNYRKDKLKSLIDKYEGSRDKLVITGDCWGENLNNLYKKTKFGLNFHFYSGRTILEVHRIIPLIANKVLVISEKSNDSWYDEKYNNLIDYFETNNYEIECLRLLENYNSDIIEKRYYDLVNNHKYVDYVKNIVHLLK